LLEALSPVGVNFGAGEGFQGVGDAEFVDVAERDDVFGGETLVEGLAAAPDTNEGDIQLLAGCVLTEECPSGENEQSGGGRGGRLEKKSTFDGVIRLVVHFLVGFMSEQKRPVVISLLGFTRWIHFFGAFV
jgi:hypothetical protein